MLVLDNDVGLLLGGTGVFVLRVSPPPAGQSSNSTRCSNPTASECRQRLQSRTSRRNCGNILICSHSNRRNILIHGIYCRPLIIILITIIPDIIKCIIRYNVLESAVAIVVRVAGLCRVHIQNGRVGFILNAMLNLHASKDTVG
jgi:hypothetical protein